MGLIIHSHVLFWGVCHHFDLKHFSSPFSVYQAYWRYKSFLCGFCTDLALNNKEYGSMMSTSSKFMKISLDVFFLFIYFLTYLFSLLIKKWGQIWKFTNIWPIAWFTWLIMTWMQVLSWITVCHILGIFPTISCKTSLLNHRRLSQPFPHLLRNWKWAF